MRAMSDEPPKKMRYELKIDKDLNEIDINEYIRLLEELLGPGAGVVSVEQRDDD